MALEFFEDLEAGVPALDGFFFRGELLVLAVDNRHQFSGREAAEIGA